ncbi:hypothetical protein U1Q18_042388 [Sarracenia purpurea var. burkii]
MEPCLSELGTRELIDPGYCSRANDMMVGRLGYGYVKFIGETDVRWLDLDQIIKFSRHVVVAYKDKSTMPLVGQGLNKAVELTLKEKISSSTDYREEQLREVARKLRLSTERHGACFISFDLLNGEWKFLVNHFGRFSLTDDEDKDILMDDGATAEVQDPVVISGGEVSNFDDDHGTTDSTMLSHSLPTHLGLDPIRMKEMRIVMFPADEEEVEDLNG